ncbi:hypothetical protein BA768_18725 [Chryseobacterium sp. CBo1]|uniref:hypothetical protein n=1 Tax=Chryseobacterium sp. CBo1 TaxID=1869230 RepID=UPI0008107E18|nr:hypothetical protein [Chryseobacterium sp. CBo1]OCK50817.1 hypothetical protein BA768_18725 [Chryseobacterium sp. CBo1]
MQKYLYLIIISLCLVSCYTYQVKKPVDPAIDNKQNPKNNAAVANNTAPGQKDVQPTPAPINVKEKLAPNKNVRIDVGGKNYKVIVDRWESDSLVAHPVRQPDKVLKFHKDQINAERIAEKRFSQPIADIITVAAYAGIGVGIWSLLQ